MRHAAPLATHTHADGELPGTRATRSARHTGLQSRRARPDRRGHGTPPPRGAGRNRGDGAERSGTRQRGGEERSGTIQRGGEERNGTRQRRKRNRERMGREWGVGDLKRH